MVCMVRVMHMHMPAQMDAACTHTYRLAQLEVQLRATEYGESLREHDTPHTFNLAPADASYL